MSIFHDNDRVPDWLLEKPPSEPAVAKKTEDLRPANNKADNPIQGRFGPAVATGTSDVDNDSTKSMCLNMSLSQEHRTHNANIPVLDPFFMESKWCTLKICTILKTPIKVHILFVLFLVLYMVAGSRRGKDDVILIFIVYGPSLLLSVVSSELVQASFLRSYGVEVMYILVWPFGAILRCGLLATPRQDFFIAVAGPSTFILFAVGWAFLFHAYLYNAPDPSLLWINVIYWSFVLNVELFCYGLLIPMYPLVNITMPLILLSFITPPPNSCCQ